MFDDNEIAPNWLYAKFTSYLFSPECIELSQWIKHGINKNSIIQYPGFKEDIYIADYSPDVTFINKIPFDNYIVVRPENLYASYVNNRTKTIIPDLVDQLLSQDYNIIYMPRYKNDNSYIRRNDKIYQKK